MKDVLANRIKGYACLLVLIGHVLVGLRSAGLAVPAYMVFTEKFMWTFHIDLFMFMSGYVYNIAGTWKSKGNRLKFLGLKLVNLGVPYLIFSIVYIVINCMTPDANNASSFMDILTLWHTPVAQYWFLYSLMWLFVFWVILSRFFNHYVITALLYAFFIIAKVSGLNLGFLDSSFNCALAFGLGSCLRSLHTEKLPRWGTPAIIATHLAVGLYLVMSGSIQILFLDDIATVLGIAASVVLIAAITRLKPIGAALDLVCKYSLPVYLLHTIFTAAVRIVLLKLHITNYLIHVTVGTAVGLVLPCLIGMIASKTPYLNIVFQPVRSFHTIRNRIAQRGKKAT